MMTLLVELSQLWSDRFPSLQKLPPFILKSLPIPGLDPMQQNGAGRSPKIRAEGDLVGSMSELPPQNTEDVLSLHQELTERYSRTILKGDRLETGDFQTRFHMARLIASEVLTSYLGKGEILEGDELIIADPTCGTGVFLLSVMDLFSMKFIPKVGKIKLVGIERSRMPLAIAWFTLTIFADLMENNANSPNYNLELVHEDLLDVIDHDRQQSRWDIILGNPPWITWTDLREEDKEKWKELEKAPGFNLVRGSGMDLMMGSINIDIGPLMFSLALHQFAKKSATFGFVFKANSENSASLYWLRKGRTPHEESRYLSITHHLKSGLSNFYGLDIAADIYVGVMDLEYKEGHGMVMQYQIKDGDLDDRPIEVLKRVQIPNQKDLDEHEYAFLPKDKRIPFRKEGEEVPEIRHGIKHDAREVYEIDEETASALNWECVFPTIKSRHVSPTDGWNGDYSLVLVPNQSLKSFDDDQFRDSYPHAFAYLEQNRDRLEKRKSRWVKQGAFYTIFGVGDYSFASYKIAWVRLGWKPVFSLINPVKLPNGETRPVVPSDHFLFIPTEDREYAQRMVTMLNSKEYQTALSLLSSKKKSSLPKKLVSKLDLNLEGKNLD